VKILIVSGIWPPDVGGPASHGPQAAEALVARGHEVEVVTTATRVPEQRAYRVRYVSRSLPPGVRHLVVAALVARRSRQVDVVYALSMVGRTSLVVRAPLVVKIAGDPAFERSTRRGFYSGTLDAFQTAALEHRAAVLRRWRTLTVRRAAHLFCPSEYLRGVVISWGIAPDRVSVLPNPTPPPPTLRPRDELRESFGVHGPLLAFAGRLTRAKALDVLSDAIERAGGVTLLVAGDGEDRALLQGDRIRLLGSLPRERVFELLAAADAAVLSSTWETFSHVLVEALSLGTPVIATRVGGVPEIVEDGVNGILVAPGDPAALAEAIRRFFADDELRARLASAARGSVARFAPDGVFTALEKTLARVARTYS
jgi:glycosyltransferase involved in cell wall biosynthesis